MKAPILNPKILARCTRAWDIMKARSDEIKDGFYEEILELIVESASGTTEDCLPMAINLIAQKMIHDDSAPNEPRSGEKLIYAGDSVDERKKAIELAISAQRYVTFFYTDADGEGSDRFVRPYKVDARAFCGHCTDRGALRSFLLKSMKNLVITTQHYEIKPQGGE